MAICLKAEVILPIAKLDNQLKTYRFQEESCMAFLTVNIWCPTSNFLQIKQQVVSNSDPMSLWFNNNFIHRRKVVIFKSHLSSIIKKN